MIGTTTCRWLLCRVADSEGEDTEARVVSGATVAPSQTKEPRIVFTGVSGAAMTKMKEVCECVQVCRHAK